MFSKVQDISCDDYFSGSVEMEWKGGSSAEIVILFSYLFLNNVCGNGRIEPKVVFLIKVLLLID